MMQAAVSSCLVSGIAIMYHCPLLMYILFSGQTESEPYKTGTIFEDLLLLKSMRSDAAPEPYQNRIKTPSVEAVELAD